jgi:hypothetical protein
MILLNFPSPVVLHSYLASSSKFISEMASAEKAITAKEPWIHPLESISVAETQTSLPRRKTENQLPVPTDTRSIPRFESEFHPDESASVQIGNPNDASPADTYGSSNAEDTIKQAADVSE